MSSRGRPSKYGSSIQSAIGRVMTAWVRISAV